MKKINKFYSFLFITVITAVFFPEQSRAYKYETGWSCSWTCKNGTEGNGRTDTEKNCWADASKACGGESEVLRSTSSQNGGAAGPSKGIARPVTTLPIKSGCVSPLVSVGGQCKAPAALPAKK